MSGKILEAFKEKKRFNIFELVLKLQVDKSELEETLDTLVGCGRLRIEEKCFFYPDNSPICRDLNSRSSISGFNGETYILNETRRRR
ncbi:MAG: hypothetical protein JRC90_06840 [Deltaproteobacteria bacterium]|nr:hypothetical protein [Deltaproteobacteria bacterium]